MSELHNALRRGTLSAAVTRALGVQADGGGVERFGETVEPILNPWGMPEWAFLRGELLGCCHESVGIVAGELGVVALINPINSDMIIVVEAVAMRGATSTVQLAQEVTLDAGLAGVGLAIPRDFRHAQGAVGLRPLRARLRTGTNAASLGTPMDQMTAGAESLVTPVIIAPGWGLAVESTTLATAIVGIMAWRERSAYPGEL